MITPSSKDTNCLSHSCYCSSARQSNRYTSSGIAFSSVCCVCRLRPARTIHRTFSLRFQPCYPESRWLFDALCSRVKTCLSNTKQHSHSHALQKMHQNTPPSHAITPVGQTLLGPSNQESYWEVAFAKSTSFSSVVLSSTDSATPGHHKGPRF